MSMINMQQADCNFPLLVEAIERGMEQEIIIVRNGHPIAKLVPIYTIPRQAGALKGRIKITTNFDAPIMDFAEYHSIG